jgi:acetate kinase
MLSARSHAFALQLPAVHILVLNVGSSSLKFQLVDTDGDAIAAARDRRLARGQIERIGGEAIITLAAGNELTTTHSESIADYAGAVSYLLRWLTRAREGDTPAITSLADIHARDRRGAPQARRAHRPRTPA